METLVTQSIVLAVLSIVTFGSGILLRKNGKPYKNLVATFHKLTVGISVVLIALIYLQHLKLFDFEGFGLFLFLFSGIVFLVALLTGIFISFEKTTTLMLTLLHRFSSWLTVLFIPVIWVICH